MEADSTSKTDNKFYHSPESAETLSNGDSDRICYICKAIDVEINVYDSKREAEDNNNHIFFAESKIFLCCGNCVNFLSSSLLCQ